MSESYLEVMVERKPSGLFLCLKYILIGLCAVTVFASFVFGTILMFLALLFGFLAYYVGGFAKVEYEYLYLDKEITIDKVLNKAKRKRVATYSVDKMEILAPINSYHLDDYKNRQAKIVDVSSGYTNQPDTRYVFFYEGSQKVIFEPTEDFVKLVKNVAPRKVFMD